MEENAEDKMFEYLLVFGIPKGGFFNMAISLNEIIQKQSTIIREKKYHPHLTALLTCLHESKESQFIQFIKEVVESISPLNVNPSHVDGFDINSVLYVDISNKKPIEAVVVKLRKKLKGMVKPFKSSKFHRTFEPRFITNLHITLEKDLNKMLYEHLLPKLKAADYNFENFRIDEMILFKKPLGPYKNQKIGAFKFLGNPGGFYIQGSLF